MTGPTQQAARNGAAARVVLTSLAGVVAFVVGGRLWFPAVWISRGRDLVLTPLLFLLLAGFALGFALLNGNDPQFLPWIVGVPLLLLVVMRFEGELDRFERFVIPYLAAIACVAAIPAG